MIITSYEGHITVLLGHNGAGKSTLINGLTGLYGMTDGDAMIYGHSLRYELSAIRRNLGVCPQQNLLIPVLTVRLERWFHYSVVSIWLCLVVYER